MMRFFQEELSDDNLSQLIFTARLHTPKIAVRRKNDFSFALRTAAKVISRSIHREKMIGATPVHSKLTLWVISLVLCLSVASAARAADGFFITLATSKSARLAALLDYILPIFKSASNVRVQVVALEPGQEVAPAAEASGADALLLDDRAATEKIIADKFGIGFRYAIYDDAAIVGPKSDPAGIRGLHEAGKALAQIAAKGAPFVSRGDGSDTNQLELRLWKSAGAQPDKSAAWYHEAKQNMAATLGIAAASNAYTLTDRASWANFTDRKDLEILTEGDPALFNVFVSIMVDPEKEPQKKYVLTGIWQGWLHGKPGFAAITSYKINGEQIFFPCQGDKLELCRAASRQ